MGLRVYELREADGSFEGCVVVDSVTGIALPLGVVYDDDERGKSAWDMVEGFVDWCNEIDGRDPRQLTPGVVESMWRRYLLTVPVVETAS